MSTAPDAGRRASLVALHLLVVLLAAPGLAAQVRINEILASNRETIVDDDGDSSDWVELVNLAAFPVDLTGHGLSDTPTAPRLWTFPGTVIGAGEHLIVWCSGKDRTQPAAVGLADPASPFDPRLVSLQAEWRYLVGAPQDAGPPPDWNLAGFDDSAWARGRPGFGYGDGDDRTAVPQGSGAVFLRHTFSWDPRAELSNLVLQVKYDDGFVAYLNGVRVLSVNFPAGEEPRFGSAATRGHEANSAERFDLSSRLELLQPGDNLIAVALLNRSPTSTDLSFIPELGTVPPVLHTSFRLDRTGESLVLSSPGGEVLDSVEYPSQSTDQSYGRSPDGAGDFVFHLEPSPGEANSGPVSATPLVVADTQFSVDRGFYEAPFQVEISTETPGAEIRYTLDGSVPTQANGRLHQGPISIADTTTLRAAAYRVGLRPTNVDTHTYIFLETPGGGGVLNQPRNPRGFPATWGARVADYAMDPRVATNTAHAFHDPRVKEGLLSLPTLSIVMELDDLFDPATGIYSNSRREGVAWERPTSVELIHPDGRPGFQLDAGLRIQGNASRSPNRPKHNMRLLFKRIYGSGKLRYRLFEDSPVDEFDTIILRGGNGDSWFHPNTTQQVRAQYIRDQWHRDMQIAMGRLTAHQIYLHLYINGLYWGLYHVFERPNASFLASYLGGNKEEYDAFNVGSVVDGNLAAWNQMVGIANSGLASPEAYAEIQQFLDVPNMIDFLLINFYSGNVDWDHRNWYGGRRRQAGAGFKFFCWDAERTFWNFDQNRANLNNAGRPTGIHQRLRANREYRVLFGDHVHRHLFNGGALTPRSAEERWMARAEEIESALSAEAARWGDNKRPSRPYTRDREWLQELRSLRRNFFPRRTGLLLGQLRAQQFYPTVAAPSFNRHGGAISPGFVVRLTAPSGTIHHVPDGSDPRLPGGALSPDARVFPAGGLFLEDSTRVTARVRAGNTWSALADATFVLDPSALRITEVMYNPPPSPDGFFGNDQFEFIELQNVGGEPLGVAGVRLAGGVDFAFPTDEIPEDLAPGAFVLVVRNLEAFASRYDTQGLRIAGEYTGALSNAGELIVLRDPVGEALLDFVYSDTWQPSTDGAGRSLVAADPGAPRAAWRGRAGWRASRREGGSPGREDHFGEGGLQRPGDINQDRVLDISDAISLLGHLFVASPAILPCEGTTDEEGNRRLLDSNGDGNVDLTDAITVLLYLFADGAPPALGTVCQPLPGCPEGCR